MKKVLGGRSRPFLCDVSLSRATDAVGKPRHFYCHSCREVVSVLTHGPREILRHFQGTKHLPKDQCLRLETPGWRVLDYEGKPMAEEEVERQRERTLRAPQVALDRDYRFAEGFIAGSAGAVNLNLLVLAKVSLFVGAMNLSTSSGLNSLCLQESKGRSDIVMQRSSSWYFTCSIFYVIVLLGSLVFCFQTIIHVLLSVCGFLHQCSRVIPEWFRKVSVFVGSREIRLI